MTDSELVITLDFDDLLCNISRGDKLPKENKEQIASFIQAQISMPREKRSLEDLFAACTVLEKADDPKLGYLLELAFEIPDPLLVSLALETLIIKWDIYEHLTERLIQYTLGASFDHDGDIRMSAFECIRHIFGMKKVDASVVDKLSQLLMHILNDDTEDKEVKGIAEELLALRGGKRKSA